jgi:uncharacterized membrane protein YraQ (UPF0718 family)
MLAGPIINVVVMLSTYVAFSGMVPSRAAEGWAMVGLRCGLGYLVAFVTSVIVELQYRKVGNALLAPMAVPDLKSVKEEDDEEPGPRRSLRQRISSISETALHDFVDITVFLILGALLAAVTRLVLPRDQIEALEANYPVAILVMMGVAILLCLCSEADAFVAASFRTMPVAAKAAFLTLGPMLDLKLYMMFTRVFRPRLIWTIIVAVVIQVFIYSIITHWILEALPDEVNPFRTPTTATSNP